ncbi:recombinase family protein [Haloarcula sp. S1CR25-12]|jgi:DNA invertase Pin-like site-specific DNA recombinase|uniref:Recombinase family protein n=2 Tax=Haloarcula TaxID=2237 RepID=A0ABU2FT95_9EURY|nr:MULTISPECIES: recombinase family protein [Haloarculaceae]MDS0261732.1 recombinase family protein [Haloarcula sp. S1CR25-12]MDS0283988.1 recombinase family protein [Halomicroarcula sp. S3CR25-11]
MPEIGTYARVSTTDQDPQRQLDELREFGKNTYDEPEIHTYADIISGTETQRGEEYQRLRVDIEDGPWTSSLSTNSHVFLDSAPAKSTGSSSSV